MKFGVGQPVRRFEDVTFLTGAGRYTDDITLPGMLVAHVLRSQVAHGILHRLETTAAAAMAGVRSILTGRDVIADGIGDVPCLFPLANRDGTPRADTPRPLLAIDRIRHVGEPLALIVADTLAQAKDAAEATEVEFEALPAVTGVETAMTSGAEDCSTGSTPTSCSTGTTTPATSLPPTGPSPAHPASWASSW
jgi:carbon-monoxide dehydrogenase large subunit